MQAALFCCAIEQKRMKESEIALQYIRDGRGFRRRAKRRPEQKTAEEKTMFDKVRKNFGFGCMRLPMQGKEVDYAEFNKMIDAFLDNGLTISTRRTGTSTVTRFACAAATNAFGKTVAAINDPDEAYAVLLEK